MSDLQPAVSRQEEFIRLTTARIIQQTMNGGQLQEEISTTLIRDVAVNQVSADSMAIHQQQVQPTSTSLMSAPTSSSDPSNQLPSQTTTHPSMDASQSSHDTSQLQMDASDETGDTPQQQHLLQRTCDLDDSDALPPPSSATIPAGLGTSSSTIAELPSTSPVTPSKKSISNSTPTSAASDSATAAAANAARRRSSQRQDQRAKAKAALPSVRWMPPFLPTEEQRAYLRRPFKRIKTEASEMTVKTEPSSELLPTNEPNSTNMEDVSVKPEGILDVDIKPTMVDGSLIFPASPEEETIDPMDSENLFPELPIPDRLFILKSRLPVNMRRSMAAHRNNVKKKAAKVEGGVVANGPLNALRTWKPSDIKPFTPSGSSHHSGGSKKSKPRQREARRNEWSGSDGDESIHSSATDHILEEFFTDDAMTSREGRPTSKKRKSTNDTPASAAAGSTLVQPSPAPRVFSSPWEQRQYELANFGVESDDDLIASGHNNRSGDESSIESEEMSDDEPTAAAAGPVFSGTAEQRKKQRQADEFERIKIHAGMELAERRAYDRLVQNEMNDAYAFCDSNPRTMVLSRDSILIKLDLSEVVSNSSLQFLTEGQLETLKSFLPECDRTPEGLSGLFSQPVFLQSLYEYQELLTTGSLDPDMREMRNVVSARRRRECSDVWKNKNFERYWGEAYSTRYSNRSEANLAKGPSNFYWKPKALKDDLHARQTMESILKKCVIGDAFALRRRKQLLIKDKKWPLPTVAELKKQREDQVPVAFTPLPAVPTEAEVKPSRPKGPPKPKKPKSATASTTAEMKDDSQSLDDLDDLDASDHDVADGGNATTATAAEQSLDADLFASIAKKAAAATSAPPSASRKRKSTQRADEFEDFSDEEELDDLDYEEEDQGAGQGAQTTGQSQPSLPTNSTTTTAAPAKSSRGRPRKDPNAPPKPPKEPKVPKAPRDPVASALAKQKRKEIAKMKAMGLKVDGMPPGTQLGGQTQAGGGQPQLQNGMVTSATAPGDQSQMAAQMYQQQQQQPQPQPPQQYQQAQYSQFPPPSRNPQPAYYPPYYQMQYQTQQQYPPQPAQPYSYPYTQDQHQLYQQTWTQEQIFMYHQQLLLQGRYPQFNMQPPVSYPTPPVTAAAAAIPVSSLQAPMSLQAVSSVVPTPTAPGMTAPASTSSLQRM